MKYGVWPSFLSKDEPMPYPYLPAKLFIPICQGYLARNPTGCEIRFGKVGGFTNFL